MNLSSPAGRVLRSFCDKIALDLGPLHGQLARREGAASVEVQPPFSMNRLTASAIVRGGSSPASAAIFRMS